MRNTYNIHNLAQQQFFQLPKLIVYGEKYKNISSSSKLAFAILLDRMKVSIKNNWVDKENNIYFIYTNKELSNILHMSEGTVIKIKKQLIEAELLKEVKTGRASKLYLQLPVSITEEESKFIIIEQRIEDASKRSNEEKKHISHKMLGNQNAKKTKKTDELQKLQSNCSVGENPENDREITRKKQLNYKNCSSELQKLYPSNTNISKTYETNETNESKNNFNSIYKPQFEQQPNIGTPLPDINMFNYKEHGIPDGLTEFIYTQSKSQEEFDDVFECIFKAKSNVSNRCRHKILLEELTQEEFIELRNVIYRSFHKQKTSSSLQNFKGYLMASLINFFEKLYPYIVEDVVEEKASIEMQVPMNNWVTDVVEQKESESIKKLKEKIAKLN